MQVQASSQSEKRARLAANRSRYAPKATPKPAQQPARDGASEVQLRKITANALEALKNPSAIPSNVIMDALRQARALNVK